MNTKKPFLLDQCHVSVLENKLTYADVEVVLQPKFIELLSVLASHYPQAITREELIDQVWDGNYFVGEKALTNAIWHLRKSFKELDPNNTYIETLRKKGYRLAIAPSSLEPAELEQKKTALFSPVRVALFTLFSAFLASFWASQHWFFVHKEASQITQLLPLTDHIETVTTRPGRELYPAVSNDEHFMAYSWRRPGKPTNLYLRDLFSPEQAMKALTNTDYVEGRTVFSPDFQRLYYYRRITAKACEIVEHTIATGEISVLAPCPASSPTDLDINSAGTELVFISQVPSHGGVKTELNILDLTSDKASIKKIPCSGECHFNDESVIFSPDAKQLVVSRNLPTGSENLYLIDVISGDARVLTSGFVDIRGVAWHPFKSQLVFSAIKQDERRGYFYNLDTHTVTDMKVKGLSYPEFTAKGNLYFHQWYIDSALMRIEVNDSIVSSPFPVLSTHFNMRYADYNEAQNKVAFVSNESGNTELWVANPDGTNREQLSSLQASVYHPVWSYDGRYIAYTANSEGKSQLFIYDFQKQLNSAPLQSGFDSYGKPAWSADNQSVLVSNNGYVYRLNLRGENLGKVIEQPANYAIETVKRDLIFANQSATQLWIKHHDTGEELVLVEAINLSNRFAWHYAQGKGNESDRVFYFNVHQGDYRLSVYDLATKQHRDVMRLPERAFSRSSGLTYIPQLDWLVYTSYKSPQIDIKRIQAEHLP
ncbi:winged helix-turn-helix domain-containing protein [Pseudoalteromonas sp. H105]|uniref:winged helix-turn-helix domain-containing protein n=1 Tax=Pseudoalteromonas sp. H105 TaxID=1348393 RepID=UPI0007321C8F|nr:winged helix-turn-helix domain-containing protein [Pseudoalteromonas sp. H105]KTF12175.1 translocation protein TolB [Pseudoalteromonas sp. H105]